MVTPVTCLIRGNGWNCALQTLTQFHTEGLGTMLSAAGLVVQELTECSPRFSVNWWSRVKASLFPWAYAWGIETGSI